MFKIKNNVKTTIFDHYNTFINESLGYVLTRKNRKRGKTDYFML